ncbi:MAG TPA: hypothetical protein ENN21_10505 [Spirochaetes bacterium]|nr:hypothetical protein [Spirochaetota bacterium]
MKYGLVRQFYNQSIDNLFKFFYKIGDFFKVLIELWWAFYDIWEAFFLIFFNIFMYFYYLLLFIIDRSAESQLRAFFSFKIPIRRPYRPGRVYDRSAVNPVPAMYGRQQVEAVGKTAAAVASTVSSSAGRLGKAASGAKTSIVKVTLEFLSAVFSAGMKVVLFPVKKIAELLSHRMRPVKEEDIPRSRSLIDEYMREYEGRKKQ